MLDKDNANTVLFERTVIDTPQADPVLPDRAVEGIRTVLDRKENPFVLQYSGYALVGIGWLNPEKGPNPPAEVTYDNFEVWQYESPQLAIHQDALVLTWPVTKGQFIVETAPGLDGPWMPLPDPWLRTSNGQCEVSIRATDSLRFFRLHQSQ